MTWLLPVRRLPAKKTKILGYKVCVVCKGHFHRQRINTTWVPESIKAFKIRLTCSQECRDKGVVCARCGIKKPTFQMGAYKVCGPCRRSMMALYKQCPGCRLYKHSRHYYLNKGKRLQYCKVCQRQLLRTYEGRKPQLSWLIKHKRIVLPEELFDYRLPDTADALHEARRRAK